MEPVVTSVDNAAKALSVCKATLYNWMNEGKVESVRVGGRRLVKIESIKRLVGEAA